MPRGPHRAGKPSSREVDQTKLGSFVQICTIIVKRFLIEFEQTIIFNHKTRFTLNYGAFQFTGTRISDSRLPLVSMPD